MVDIVTASLLSLSNDLQLSFYEVRAASSIKNPSNLRAQVHRSISWGQDYAASPPTLSRQPRMTLSKSKRIENTPLSFQAHAQLPTHILPRLSGRLTICCFDHAENFIDVLGHAHPDLLITKRGPTLAYPAFETMTTYDSPVR